MEANCESRGYLLDEYRLFHLRDAQGTKVESHYHEFYKLLILVSGTGEYMVEGRRYHLEPGDMVLVERNCVHRPEFPAGVPYERIILYISGEFLARFSEPDCDLAACFSGERGHVLRPGEGQGLLGLALQLERTMKEEGYGSALLSQALLLQLLVGVGRALRSQGAQLPQPLVSENRRILEIQRYLDTHLEEDVTISCLSEKFFLSKYHMMRLFRQETGRTIHTYLSQQRLLRARDLMAGGLSATESCFRAGFGSYSSFIRAYRQQFGVTPTGRPRDGGAE